jgi:4-amino-4-deoxy-L-arabinose transferase-like glycosyltransferase
MGWGIGDYPLMDLDEPRYPEAAREMIESSQYWVPMTNGKMLFEKPILIYWSLILSFKTFGITEFAARLPSVIAGSLTVAMTYVFGRFFKIGLCASLILLSSVEFFVISRMSIPEMLLNLFIISSIAVYFLISQNLINKNYFYLMALLMAFGFLAKGPLAIFVPGLVIFTYTILQHVLKDQSIQEKIKLILENKKIVIISSLIFLLVGLSWYVVAHVITDGGFTKQFFLTENLQRYTSTLSGHKFPWWFYLGVAFIGFMPWSIFIPAYLVKFKENLSKSNPNFQLKIFSLGWVISNILFFSSSGTKLYNYVFSIFFPLSILAALWFLEQSQKRTQAILFTSIAITLISCILITLNFLGVFNTVIQKEDFLRDFISPNLFLILSFVILSFGLIGIIFYKQESLKKYFLVIFIIFMAAHLYCLKEIIMPLSEYKSGGIKKFASHLPKGVKLFRLNIDRPSLTFYSRTYSQSITQKIFLKKIENNRKFCILAKKDRLDLFRSIPSLKILNTDQKYIYACVNMPSLVEYQ